jgi:aminoglycoside 2'-N-acetyltransferase I
MVTRRKPDDDALGAPRVRLLATAELTPDEVAAIRGLMAEAFGDDEDDRFEDADWEHARGGTHVVLDVDGVIVAHAAVVERELHVDGHPVRTGYVEAVATAPAHQGEGLGTIVMQRADAIIAESFELGALGTGSHHFYERLGWRTWRGPAFVRLPAGGDQRTPDEEGYILVIRTPTTPEAVHDGLDAPISCDWRPGDVW